MEKWERVEGSKSVKWDGGIHGVVVVRSHAYYIVIYHLRDHSL